MNVIRTKNLSQKTTWEATSTKRPNYSSKAYDQPSTSTQGKGNEVECQNLANDKKKEVVNKGKAQNNFTRPSLGKCFRCGQSGHLPNTCPQQKTIALTNEEDDLIIEDSKELEKETELIEADDGDRISCVIQRVLIAPKEERNPQRHSLIKTRCTINGEYVM